MNNRYFGKDSWIRQLVFVLLASLLSSFCTWYFMRKQMYFDINKELYFRQMHVYNKVSDLYRNFGLYRTRMVAPTQKRTVKIFVDAFGNEIRQKEILDSLVKVDTLNVTVPNFVVIDAEYDNFFENIQYLKDNKDQLSPDIYKKVEAILDFLEKHPVPEKKDRMAFLLYWGNEAVYGDFYKLLKQLYLACNEE